MSFKSFALPPYSRHTTGAIRNFLHGFFEQEDFETNGLGSHKPFAKELAKYNARWWQELDHFTSPRAIIFDTAEGYTAFLLKYQ